MPHRGNLYIIAAPSGTGKTSLVKALIDSMPNITVSISHTTRQQRPGEVDGINYYFIDRAEFAHRIEQNDFLEYASIFGNYYGTSKTWVENTLAKGIDVILEIDWQGHQQIKRLFPDSIGIFILPPSLADLRERLTKRNQDSTETIENRLSDARETISHSDEFSYLIINDDFTQALADLTVIITASRLLQRCQAEKFAPLIESFKKT